MSEARTPEVDAALSRHQHDRERGDPRLSVLPLGVAAAAPMWARWAGGHGAPVIAIAATEVDDALREVIAALPLGRVIHAARRRLATAAGRPVEAIDAAMAARGPHERAAWVAELSPGRANVIAAGWVLGALLDGVVPDPAAAPLPIEALAAALVELGGPVAVLVAPANGEVAGAARLAVSLVALLRRQAIALAVARRPLEAMLATQRESGWLALVRQGIVAVDVGADVDGDFDLDVRVPELAHGSRPPADVVGAAGTVARALRRKAGAQGTPAPEPAGRSDAERRLLDALDADPRTRGRFVLGGLLDVLFAGRPTEIDLLDRELAIAVEVDGWRHFQDPERYRTDRRKEVVLQRAGVLVVRVLADDVDARVEILVNDIADVVDFCRTRPRPSLPLPPPAAPRARRSTARRT